MQDFSEAIIGVNNRDLKSFTVDIENSIRLKQLFNQDNLFVAESGIKGQSDINKLLQHGINIFLNQLIDIKSFDWFSKVNV